MVDIALALGNISFQGFEVPSSISLTGKQKLVTHRLMGGAQIIDVLGRDKEAIEWKGTLSGSDASARACELDRLRLAGEPLVLTWDIYSFRVLIESFAADYRSPWWIPYAMTCAVLQDLSSPVADAVGSVLDAIAADLDVAGQYFPVGGFQAAIAAGSVVPGSAAYAASLAAGQAAQASVSGQLVSAGGALDGSFGVALAACGTIANLAAGQGYLARAVTNLSNLEP